MRRKGRRVLGLAGLGLLALAWALVLRPTSLGGPTTYVVVQGSSMLPTYDTGDLVIVRAADAYAIGDVVAYRVPDGEVGQGRVVIHRVVGEGPVGFAVKGDNNEAPDPWTPAGSDIVGTPWVRIPALGRVLALLHQPATLAALAAALVVTMMLARAPRARMKEGSGAIS